MNHLMKTTHQIFVLICLLIIVTAPISINADNTSVLARLAPKSLLLGAARAGNHLVVVGERGHVLRSSDHGQSWQQIIVPTRATLTAVTFIDPLQGLAVGHDLTILRTEDGGLHWQLVHEDRDEQPPFLDVLFLDEDIAFAVGAYGTFFESADGGRSWAKRWISEDDFHLNAIVTTNSAIYLAAEAGTVYKSSDNGESFNELYPDYDGSFFGLLPVKDNSLFLYGLRGNLFHSDDGGETWHQLDTDTDASLTSGLLLADGTLVIAGLSGTLLIVTEQDFDVIIREDPDRKGFSKLLETADGQVMAVGDFGVTLLPQSLLRLP